MILPSFEYLDGPTKLTFFLLDLTRVKSNRACRPLAGAFRARPGRRGRISGRQGSCLPALRLRAGRSGLTICHWQIVRAALTPLPAGCRPSAIGPGEGPPGAVEEVVSG